MFYDIGSSNRRSRIVYVLLSQVPAQVQLSRLKRGHHKSTNVYILANTNWFYAFEYLGAEKELKRRSSGIYF